MDQTQTIDSDELQQAIDNITNTTSVDPVFSDPVAAPSSVPEGDTGALDEPVGPFPVPKVEIPTAQPEPLAPVMAGFEVPEIPTQPDVQVQQPTAVAEPAPISIPSVEIPSPMMISEGLTTQQVKEAALRDLMPILGKLNINPSQKFRIYRDTFETLRDYTVLDRAYQAAKDITDEAEKAEALLYLVEAIDRM